MSRRRAARTHCALLLVLCAGVISITKGSVRFSVKGDIGTGNITRKNHIADKDEESTKVRRRAGSGKGPPPQRGRLLLLSLLLLLLLQVEMESPVELTFALRYLSHFTKATPLASQVRRRRLLRVVPAPRSSTRDPPLPPAGVHQPLDGCPTHDRVQDREAGQPALLPRAQD